MVKVVNKLTDLPFGLSISEADLFSIPGYHSNWRTNSDSGVFSNNKEYYRHLIVTLFQQDPPFACELNEKVIARHKKIIRKTMAIVIHSDKAELPRENKVNEHAKNLKFESIKELYKHMSFVAARVIMNAACNTTHGIIADTAIVYQEKESEFIGMEQYKLVAVEPSFDKKDSVDAIRIDSENYISFRYYFIAVDSNKIDKLYDLRREAVIKLFGKKIINTANKVLKAIREESVYAEQIASLVAADLQTKYTDTGMEFGSW